MNKLVKFISFLRYRNKNALYITLKVGCAIAIIPIALITFHFLSDNEGVIDYVIACIAIIISTIYIIYPFIYDYSNLAQYVKHLSFNRPVQPPKFESYAAIIELSESLDLLNKSWQKRENDLLEGEAESKLIISSIPEILFVLNEHLVITKANKTAQRLFGYTLVGQNLREIIDNKILIGAARWVLHDQKGKRLEVNLSPMLDRDFQVFIEIYDASATGQKNLIVMLNDITEHKRTETMLADFIANASHEIRTPLTSIIGILETLENSNWKDEEARAMFIPIVIEQAHRMKFLINDLLSLSSIERRLNTPPTEEVSIREVLNLVLKQLEWDLIQANIKTNKNLKKKLPTIIGDFNEIVQVAYNLISNAIKYGKNNTTITIDIGVTQDIPKPNRVIATKKALFFSVTDQGPGIAKEHIERLTERFYRVDKSRSKRLGGTGLGLAIVKQILTRHGGFLDIKSEPGSGSTFTFYLPIPEQKYDE